jgi:dsDNA-binding SOS-regulon protein
MLKRSNAEEHQQGAVQKPERGTTFLSRLYRYLPRENRSPMEDFLTECLAELLNELSRIKGGIYIKELLRLDQVLPNNLEFKTGFQWSSQTAIADVGRPDLRGRGVSKDGNGIHILIENKVSAGYTHSGGIPQLDRYKRYLDTRPERYKALILITHSTLPPPSSKPTVSIIIRWREIADTLHAWEQNSEFSESPHAKGLSLWLMNFLEDQDMGEINLSLAEIASVPAYQRLLDACDALGGVIHQKVETLSKRFSGAGLIRPRADGWGEFKDAGYGPSFYGDVWTPKGIKADDCGVVAWAGIMLGTLIYEVPPVVPGVPELSIGIGLWLDPDSDTDTIESKLADMRKRLEALRTSMNADRSWEIQGNEKVVFLRKAHPLVQYYHPDVDWADAVDRFFENSVAEISEANPESLKTVVDWQESDVEAEETEAES